MRLFVRAGCAALFATLTAALSAQEPSQLEQDLLFRQTQPIRESVKSDAFQTLFKNRDALLRYNALRVAKDLNGSNADFAYYVVPALSNIQRLPDQFPVDGKINASVDVVMARGEFEPASVVLYSAKDQDKVQLTVSDLKNEKGQTIKAADVDLKVIKVWYQNGNAWFSYFGDFSRKLVPELLLNDENLIKVDTAKKENYLRLNYENGEKYMWISAPEQIDPHFNRAQEPAFDAKTLQPVKLTAGEFKQFFITVRTTKDTAPGLYKGTLSIGNLAKAPVRVRVMPFTLPDPKTYYDTSKDFYTMLYCVSGAGSTFASNGHDRALSDKNLYDRFVNQVNHNVVYPLYLGLWRGYSGLADVERAIALAKKAGMKLDPFFEAFGCHATNNVSAYLNAVRNYKIAQKEFNRLLGHNNLWPAGGEEPGYGRVVGARQNWKAVHDLGMHVMCNGGDRRHFCNYNDEFRVGGGFANKRESEFMHKIKGRIGNYAGPHTGPENPDYMRRMHGINLYKKEYDMMYNYGYHEGNWNDFHTSTYRNMCLVYYTKDGIIDTLAWEGVREGIDDIRYATLLLTMAEKLVNSKVTDEVYTAKKAMAFLALLNEESADLPAMRMEMINHILKLSAMLHKGGK